MSNRQTLKDKHFNVIGYIDTESSGRSVLKDKHFNIVGYYEPKTNTTKDKHFNIVGKGNLLTMLLNQP